LKDKPVTVEVECDGERHRGFAYGWRFDEGPGWVAQVRYTRANEWGRCVHVVPAERVCQSK
jgi:hypothetical protein